MEIRINGQTADITPDKEKTVGEIIAGLEQWLIGLGHRLSGLSIDGQAVSSSLLEESFKKEINAVKILDIYTSSLADLCAECLLSLLADIKEYEKLKFEEKKEYIDTWKEKPQALFICEQMPDLYNFFVNMFSGGELNESVVFSITEERLREVRNPFLEFSNLQPLVTETCSLLESLPLDIQTGKDSRAAQTIQIFSSIAEKILRILKQLDIQGLLELGTDIEKQFTQIIGDFGNLVKELLEAYEKYDTVLVGDLAEYEAAPRLKELYAIIIKNSRMTAATDK